LLAGASEKKTAIGFNGKSAVLLINGPKELKDKKVTMDKDVSAVAIKAGLNYTGKEVESDGTVVSSTGFDLKTAREFLEAFAGNVSRRTEPRN
jgi:hypothetical protein